MLKLKLWGKMVSRGPYGDDRRNAALSSAFIKQGVEAYLKKEVPEVAGVEQVA